MLSPAHINQYYKLKANNGTSDVYYKINKRTFYYREFHATDSRLDLQYDVVGIYNADGDRTAGQSTKHAYIWQYGYQYRPGTLVTDTQ